jgi:transposase-like protein
MTIYPDEQKTNLIERMLPPQNANVPALAKETGIPADTLYGWRRQARRTRGLGPAPAGSSERWSAAEKFAMGVEAAALNEAERGEYCRRRGLYPEQLQSWRRACEQANAGQAAPRPRNDAPADKRRIQALERELRRKDKALAEAAALLVLRKKADAIWGTNEDV